MTCVDFQIQVQEACRAYDATQEISRKAGEELKLRINEMELELQASKKAANDMQIELEEHEELSRKLVKQDTDKSFLLVCMK